MGGKVGGRLPNGLLIAAVVIIVMVVGSICQRSHQSAARSR
jgi:hypothetical protein